MNVAIVIPARYASTRLTGKPLADIAGKPMIQWVYERAKMVDIAEEVLVASDEQSIIDMVEGFGGKAVMTSKGHTSGTDRVAEVAEALDADIVVNLQGDEPFIEPKAISDVINPVITGRDILMCTLKKRLEDSSKPPDPNIVKVVTDKDGFALYFSRCPVPCTRNEAAVTAAHYKHIGLYAYERNFLLTIAGMDPTPLELLEGLEQLRVLENGYRIKVVETECDSMSVDTPEDLERARKIGVMYG